MSKSVPSSKSKSSATTATSTTAIPESLHMRILKIGSTSTVSGKSTLRYQIACDPKLDIYIRIVENTAAGYFSDEHVSLKAIQEVFLKAGDKPISSFALFPLLIGRSQNTPAFICSCLLAEGLIQRSEQKPRCYVAADGKKFMAEIKQLIDAGTDLKVAEKVKPEKSGKANPSSKSAVAVAAKVTSSKSKSAVPSGSISDWAREGAEAEPQPAPVESKIKPKPKK